MWVGSLDHWNGAMFRGFSSAPDEAPATWTSFTPPGGFSHPETPYLVWDDTEARPWRLYYHPIHSDSGGLQNTRLTSYAADWTGGTDEGEMLPATASANPILSHTGYAMVERRAADDWHCWSLTNGGTAPGGATFGYWTSTTGESWTCVEPDLDVTSMCASGRRLEVTNLSRVQIDGVWYGVMLEKNADSQGGGGAFETGAEVVICTMVDEQTFGPPTVIWTPPEHHLKDNLGNVTAVQDPDDERLIHIFPHIDSIAVYHVTYRVP